MDAIIIEGLKVDTVVGCFNWERQIIQPLMLDLNIRTNLEQAAQSDELEDTFELCRNLRDFSAGDSGSSAKIDRTCSKTGTRRAFATFESVESIMITIRKPAIIAQANSVGIRLERHRNDIRPSTGE